MNADRWIDLFTDCKQAFRSLRKAPLFVVIVLGTLAVGIGINTTMFSIIDAVLLRPLSHTDPEELLLVGYRTPDDTSTYGLDSAEYFAIVDSAEAFASLAFFDYGGGTLSGDGQAPEEPTSLSIDTRFAETLGVTPILGRNFTEEECIEGGPNVLILGEQLWNRRYGADADVIGKKVIYDGEPFEVVGVMPDSFRFPQETVAVQVFRPRELKRSDGERSLGVVARLAPGVDIAQADSQLAVLSAGLAEQDAERYEDRVMFGRALLDEAVGEVRSSLLVLWAAVAFVLLLSCMNVANLMLSRALTKVHDLAVCSAIGASRGRITQRLLSESLLLGAVAGLLGLLLAQIGLETIAALGMTDLPRAQGIGLDPRAFLFTFALGLVTGVACGLLPAWRLTRLELSEMVKEGGESRGSAGPGSLRLRAFLTAGEVAIACVLLIGAGLLVRSSFKLRSTDPGFDHRNVLGMTMWADTPADADAGWTVRFYNDILDKLRNLPGVESAATVTWMPWRTIFDSSLSIVVDGHPEFESGEAQQFRFRVVSEGYFDTMRIPVVAGRDFGSQDTPEAAPSVIVSRKFADRFWPEGQAIGNFISAGRNRTKVQIVGIVGDIRERGIDEVPTPSVYAPFSQNPQINASIMVRTSGDPAALTRASQAAIWEVSPTQGIWRTTTLEEMLKEQLAEETLYMKLLAIFAIVAVILAAAGIYGVISFSVSQRTREIGIRMALGAANPSIRRNILTGGLRLSAIGLLVGLPGAYAVARMLGSLLYGVGPADPATYLSVVLLVVVVTTGACTVPALRATRVQPAISLRAE